MAIFVVFTFAMLYTCNFFTNLPIVAGDPTKQSGKHTLASYCEVMLTTDDESTSKPASDTYDYHLDLLLTASNYPFNATTYPYSDLKVQTSANALANLLHKLPIMEDVNDILYDSAWDAVSHNANYTGYRLSEWWAIQRVFDIRPLIEKSENTILANASLAPLYKEEKSKAENIPLPAVLVTMDNSLKTNQRYFDFMTRQSVLGFALKPCYEFARSIYKEPEAFRFHYLSQAVLQLARTDKVNRIQPIFDETIKITGEKLQASADHNFDFIEIFFSMLEEKLMKDPELDNVRTTIKNDLTKKYGI